jgi:thiol peroxidase
MEDPMTRSRVRCYPALCLTSLLGLAGCAGFPGLGGDTFTYRDLPVAKTSATAGEGHSVTFRGGPAPLAGPGIKVGDTLRDVQLAKSDLSLINIAETRGTVRIISVVPSLDTPVCEQQTHYLSEKSKGLDQTARMITVSVDTPFAQNRFSKEAGIDNVMFLSDFRGGDFGKTYGLLVKEPHFLARAVMVVDRENVVRYLQITPELGQMPDMESAFAAARALP